MGNHSDAIKLLSWKHTVFNRNPVLCGIIFLALFYLISVTPFFATFRSSTFVLGVLFISELVAYEIVYCWYNSFVWWDNQYHEDSHADVFLNVWKQRTVNLSKTITRDTFRTTLKRMARFCLQRFLSHGYKVMCLYLVVLYFRLHSVLAVFLDNAGLGFLDLDEEGVIIILLNIFDATTKIKNTWIIII